MKWYKCELYETNLRSFFHEHTYTIVSIVRYSQQHVQFCHYVYALWRNFVTENLWRQDTRYANLCLLFNRKNLASINIIKHCSKMQTRQEKRWQAL